MIYLEQHIIYSKYYVLFYRQPKAFVCVTDFTEDLGRERHLHFQKQKTQTDWIIISSPKTSLLIQSSGLPSFDLPELISPYRYAKQLTSPTQPQALAELTCDCALLTREHSSWPKSLRATQKALFLSLSPTVTEIYFPQRFAFCHHPEKEEAATLSALNGN